MASEATLSHPGSASQQPCRTFTCHIYYDPYMQSHLKRGWVEQSLLLATRVRTWTSRCVPMTLRFPIAEEAATTPTEPASPLMISVEEFKREVVRTFLLLEGDVGQGGDGIITRVSSAGKRGEGTSSASSAIPLEPLEAAVEMWSYLVHLKYGSHYIEPEGQKANSTCGLGEEDWKHAGSASQTGEEKGTDGSSRTGSRLYFSDAKPIQKRIIKGAAQSHEAGTKTTPMSLPLSGAVVVLSFTTDAERRAQEQERKNQMLQAEVDALLTLKSNSSSSSKQSGGAAAVHPNDGGTGQNISTTASHETQTESKKEEWAPERMDSEDDSNFVWWLSSKQGLRCQWRDEMLQRSQERKNKEETTEEGNGNLGVAKAPRSSLINTTVWEAHLASLQLRSQKDKESSYKQSADGSSSSGSDSEGSRKVPPLTLEEASQLEARQAEQRAKILAAVAARRAQQSSQGKS